MKTFVKKAFEFHVFEFSVKLPKLFRKIITGMLKKNHLMINPIRSLTR